LYKSESVDSGFVNEYGKFLRLLLLGKKIGKVLWRRVVLYKKVVERPK